MRSGWIAPLVPSTPLVLGEVLTQAKDQGDVLNLCLVNGTDAMRERGGGHHELDVPKLRRLLCSRGRIPPLQVPSGAGVKGRHVEGPHAQQVGLAVKQRSSSQKHGAIQDFNRSPNNCPLPLPGPEMPITSLWPLLFFGLRCWLLWQSLSMPFSLPVLLTQQSFIFRH